MIHTTLESHTKDEIENRIKEFLIHITKDRGSF